MIFHTVSSTGIARRTYIFLVGSMIHDKTCGMGCGMSRPRYTSHISAAVILRTSVMSGDRQNLLRKEVLFFWGGAELNCSSGLFSFSHLHRHFLNMFGGGTLRWNIPMTFISACCRPSPNSPIISQ